MAPPEPICDRRQVLHLHVSEDPEFRTTAVGTDISECPPNWLWMCADCRHQPRSGKLVFGTIGTEGRKWSKGSPQWPSPRKSRCEKGALPHAWEPAEDARGTMVSPRNSSVTLAKDPSWCSFPISLSPFPGRVKFSELPCAVNQWRPYAKLRLTARYRMPAVHHFRKQQRRAATPRA